MKSYLWIKYSIAVIAGMFLAVISWKIAELEFRYTIAISVGICVLCIAMALINRIEDFIIYGLIFNAPFDRFGKWMFARKDEIIVAHGISVGLAEILLFVAYTVWFSQVFISKKKIFPKFQIIDYFIFMLLCAQIFSMIGAPQKMLSFFDIIYNIKHFLIYFFILHKIKYSHIRWIIVIILFSVTLEASVAVYERTTGNVGIGHSKGNIENSRFGEQYDVPGFEGAIRAEGTTKDSHALGLYFGMLLPILFVFSITRYLRFAYRWPFYLVLLYGVIGLVVTFTRAGWICFAVSSVFALGIVMFLEKSFKPIIIPLVFVVLMSITYPQAYKHIYDRFSGAPPELISSRYDMVKTSISVWSNNFLFGCGAGNYVYAFEQPDVIKYESGKKLPVHFLPLYVAAEIGIFGVIAFYTIIGIAIYHSCKFFRCKNVLLRGMAIAIVAAFVSYLFDGLSSPLGRELVPYYTLWIYIAISLAFRRIDREHGTLLTNNRNYA